MLAYVFWHWPSADSAAAEYENLQRAFHTALAESAPSGFVGSTVFRVAGHAPWLGGTPAYADWYLVQNSAALDPLNVAAVSGVCEQPHAAVAHAMAAGAGSLFALRGDRADITSARHLACLTKPRPLPYDAFYASIPPTPAAASLWRRQMVLGPTPEFALLTPTSTAIPETFQPVGLDLTPIT